MNGISYERWDVWGVEAPAPVESVNLAAVDWSLVDLDDVDWALLRTFCGIQVMSGPRFLGLGDETWFFMSATRGAWGGTAVDTLARGLKNSPLSRARLMNALAQASSWSDSSQRGLWWQIRATNPFGKPLADPPQFSDVLHRFADVAPWDVEPMSIRSRASMEAHAFLPVPLLSDASTRTEFESAFVPLPEYLEGGGLKKAAWVRAGGSVYDVLNVTGEAAEAASHIGSALLPLARQVQRLAIEDLLGQFSSLPNQQLADLGVEDPVRVARLLSTVPDRCLVANSLRYLLRLDADPLQLAWSLLVWSAPDEVCSMDFLRPDADRFRMDALTPAEAALAWWGWVADVLDGVVAIPAYLPWDGPRDPVPLERILATG